MKIFRQLSIDGINSRTAFDVMSVINQAFLLQKKLLAMDYEEII
jgi:hypothetical protein